MSALVDAGVPAGLARQLFHDHRELREAPPRRGPLEDCIRCPMLRIDPRQRPRLTEVIHNLTERITGARLNGWLGEVQGLQTSLDAAKNKLAALNRQPTTPAALTHLGIPTISRP